MPGQIFVEVERARVTRILSDIKKSQGDIAAATEILCELQVETFGSMTRREKTEFILEQVSLCIQKGDWTQAGILSRKISTRYLGRKPKKTAEQLEKERKEAEEREKKRGPDEAPEEPEDDVTDLKLAYFEQQITLAKHDDKYLDACKHYRQVLDTEAVENNPEQLRAVRTSLANVSRPETDYQLGPSKSHLLRHPRPSRQRAIGPPPPHPPRYTKSANTHRRCPPQPLHRARAHALAVSCRKLRPPSLLDRHLRRRGEVQ